ncbi:phasin family protein [Candidatus Poribacteria bacterium]|nr:phasin family protein [Candidatus Poribacteria bacterium]
MATRKAKKTDPKKAAAKGSARDPKWTWIDVLRTPILASVGAFSIAEEGIEKFVRDLVERGEASEKEGKKIVSDFRRRTQRNRKDLESSVDERIEKALKSFRLPTKKDVEELSKKIDQLERKIARLPRKVAAV